MKKKLRLLVVIVNYKTPGLVLGCINSLHGQLDYDVDHIVVVDNNSGGDEVYEMTTAVEKKGLSLLVTIIASHENKGFSAGNNIGVKAFGAEYYLLANGDTLFRELAITNLLNAAKKYPQAGIISPRLEWKDGEPQISCFRCHSHFPELIDAAGTGVITSLLHRYNVPLKIVEEVTTPEWTSFACVLIRSKVFQQIGYLDEGYFMYYEDVDYCRRAKKAGFELINYPDSRVVHLRGQSSGMKKLQREKKRLPAYHYHSRTRYYTKFYGRIGFWASNVCWLAGRSVSLAREILFGKKRTVPEYQYIDIWKHQ